MKINRMFRTAAVLVCAVFLIAMLVPGTHAEEADRYGYSQLKNENQRVAYQAIAAGIGALDVEIVINIAGVTNENPAGFEDIQFAEQMVAKDYPEYFWYHERYSLQSDGNQVKFLPEAYSVNGQQVSAGSSQLAAAQAQVDAAVADVLSKIPANPSDYEIAHTIHDYVVEKVEYVQVGDHQTAYGALGCGKAVCAGYARAYQLLMNKAGISCWYVTGQSYAPDGSLVGHAWNLVWLDGKCYYSDATWDDQGSELFHEYLNMSLEEISQTHFTNDPLPAPCGHDTYTFFRMNDGNGVCDIRDHKTAEEVAGCFVLKSQTGTEATYYCTIHYHGDDFSNWLQSNVGTIAQKLGYVGGYGYQIIELGHEHHVTLTGQVSGSSTPSQPTEPAPGTQPTEPEPSTQPTEAPTQPTTGTQPSEPPVQPTVSTQPTDAPTQPPVQTEPVQTPTQSGDATESTDGTTEATQETPSTEPVETQEDTGETGDTGTGEPEGGNQDDQPSGSTDHPEMEPSQTDVDIVESSGHESNPQTVPSATKDAQQGSDSDHQNPGDLTGILVGAAVVVVAGGITVAILVLKKKKNK